MRLLPLLLALVLPTLAAGDADRPRHNNSYVPDDDYELNQMVFEATRAAETGKPELAAERLHALLGGENSGVVALHRREVFASPRRWAQIQLLADRAPFGPEVLDAWRRLHDAEGNRFLAQALRADDEGEIEGLLARYPAATAAPAILLALCDRALQHGDADAAEGHLLRSVEHQPRSAEAAWIESAPYVARLKHLRQLDRQPVPDWPTLGGGPARTRHGTGSLRGSKLRLIWSTPFLVDVPGSFEWTDPLEQRERSPQLPFAPVCDAERVYLHLGGSVAAISRKEGRLLFYAPGDRETPLSRINAMLDASPGRRSVTVDEGVLFFDRLLFDTERGDLPHSRNELIAYDVDGRRVIWRVRSASPFVPEGSVLSRPVFFRGAPAIRGERLYVYGAIREMTDEAPTRNEEAHLFCFHKRTGELIWERFLGYGDTEAAAELPPLSGQSPAVAAGVAVVVTGMGVAAGVDARSGEILWMLRYDRKPGRERERLREEHEQKVYLGSGWFREPPHIRGDSVYFAPFDSEYAYRCWLRGSRQPSDGTYAVVQWDKHRAQHPGRNALAEYLVGVHGERIYYVARRDEHHSRASYQTVVSHPVEDEVSRYAYARIPAIERDRTTGVGVPPPPYGYPQIAGDVLLVPTRKILFRFDLAGAPGVGPKETSREIPALPPLPGPDWQVGEGDETPASFGTLLALDGRIYAVTLDRVHCYQITD